MRVCFGIATGILVASPLDPGLDGGPGVGNRSTRLPARHVNPRASRPGASRGPDRPRATPRPPRRCGCRRTGGDHPSRPNARCGGSGRSGLRPFATAPKPCRGSIGRNRSECLSGRAEFVALLSRKRQAEPDDRLLKALRALTRTQIAVRLNFEWHDDSGYGVRTEWNENRAFAAKGLMRQCPACIDQLPITVRSRKFPRDRFGPRPADPPGF
ncbi:DUF1348 family protein [Methylobacterium planeticum]|nr:DUF1348 family protein [Methylobacterium planeticum]